jgi:hypothetical protein
MRNNQGTVREYTGNSHSQETIRKQSWYNHGTIREQSGKLSSQKVSTCREKSLRIASHPRNQNTRKRQFISFYLEKGDGIPGKSWSRRAVRLSQIHFGVWPVCPVWSHDGSTEPCSFPVVLRDCVLVLGSLCCAGLVQVSCNASWLSSRFSKGSRLSFGAEWDSKPGRETICVTELEIGDDFNFTLSAYRKIPRLEVITSDYKQSALRSLCVVITSN